jgi:hypothetical protein
MCVKAIGLNRGCISTVSLSDPVHYSVLGPHYMLQVEQQFHNSHLSWEGEWRGEYCILVRCVVVFIHV